MVHSLSDLTPYPPLARLLRQHGGTLLLNCAASADALLEREAGIGQEYLDALRDEAGRLIGDAAYELTPGQRIALAYQDSAAITARFLARKLPTLLVDALKALLGKPLPGASLYLEAFPLVYDYERTCSCVGASPDYLEFFTHALRNPVK